MLYISAAYAVIRCLSVRMSVCLSVAFVYFIEIIKHVFKLFSPSGSHTILVFHYQTLWQCSDGDPSSNGGVECRWGKQQSRFSTNIYRGFEWWSVINSFDRGVKCITSGADDARHASVNLVYDSKARRRFLSLDK